VLPALMLGLWAASTLSWMAFAFAPLPSDPPAWLTAARYACFGTVGAGLPAAWGLMMLILSPLTLLAGIVVLWGRELVSSVRRVARSPLGQAVVAVLGIAVIVEGSWVASKMRAARQTDGWVVSALPQGSMALPGDYPRGGVTAPGFTLVDQHGDAVSLARLRGRPVVVTFVYAHCQTLCPMIVETLKQALPGAPSSEVLLVTLDPWRDTPSTLATTAQRWAVPAGFHVLSSRSVDAVLGVARAYDVPFERDERSGDVVHPALVYVIDAEGRLAYTFNNPPAAWVRDALERVG
jgi:protein SCO1